MKRRPSCAAAIAAAVVWAAAIPARAGQAPFAGGAPDVPVSHRDRVHAAEQFSNTVSVIEPAHNQLLASFASAIRSPPT